MRMLDFKPTLVLSAVQRADAASGANRSAARAWAVFLQAKTATNGYTPDLEKKYLRANGGTGDSYTDMWGNYLGARGFATGNLADRMRAFLKDGTLV